MSERRVPRRLPRGRLAVGVGLVVVTGAVGLGFASGALPQAAQEWAERRPSPTSQAPPTTSATTSSAAPVPSPSTPAVAPRTWAPAVARRIQPGSRLIGSVPLAESLVDHAPVVVTTSTEPPPDVAITLARRLRAPMVAPADLASRIPRWGVDIVVDVVTLPGSPVPVATGIDVRRVTRTVDGNLATDPILDLLEQSVPPPDPRRGPVVLAHDAVDVDDALDTVLAAVGAQVVPVRTSSLLADAGAAAALSGTRGRPWVTLGPRPGGDGPLATDRYVWQVEVLRTGRELPGGGHTVFPGRRFVALYGSPGSGALGVLGEQPVDAAVERARALTADYAVLSDVPVVPTFEIIATVASGRAGARGDYSQRVAHDVIEPWIRAAGEAGMYVVLDLQPGRTDFLTQAREYEALLRYPHVGLALDPEWRLGPTQVHLRQVGSVAVEEVQAVADWLAELTREARLPQKLLLLHQFRLSMIRGRERLVAPPELAVAIQMDGQGSQPAKDATWQAITTLDPPEGVWFGWKNFYDEDPVVRSPADTLAATPTPVLVSYQ